jgi:hypothetical protein
MRTAADSSALSPNERRHDLAALLAGAVLRLHARAAIPAPENHSNSDQDCLELPADPRLSVHTGYEAERHRETKGPMA